MGRHRPSLTALPRWAPPALGALPAAWLAVFFAWPVATMALRAGTPSVDLGIVRFTLLQATASTAATLVAGMAPAYVLARFDFRGRRLALAMVTVPFMLPTVVVGAAFIALLPEHLHRTTAAIVMAHVFFNMAVVVRLVGSMWSVIPHELTGAARTLGAAPLQLARHVVLPLLRPGIVAAAIVVFLFSVTSYGTVLLLGGPARPTVEIEIVRLATQLGAVERAVALSVVQLVVLGVVAVIAARAQRMASRAIAAAPQRRAPRTRRERTLIACTALLTAAAVAAPMLALVAQSFRVGGRPSLEAWRRLVDPVADRSASLGIDPLASMVASMRTAAVATILSVSLGLLGSLAIAAGRRRLAAALDTGLMLPLGTSAVTVGLGMLITFDSAPYDWRSEWWLVAVGHALIAVPFVVRAALPVIRAVPADHVAAACMLGASPWRAWREVIVRRAGRPLLVGAGLSAAISLGEFGATTFLTRAGRETMPIAVSRLLARAGDIPRAQGFALATVLLVITAVIIAATDLPDRTPQ